MWFSRMWQFLLRCGNKKCVNPLKPAVPIRDLPHSLQVLGRRDNNVSSSGATVAASDSKGLMGADDARMLVDLSSIVAQCDEEMTTAPQELTQSLAPKSSTPFLSLPVTTTTLALASNCTFFTSCSTPQYSAQAEVQSVDLMPPPSSKRMLVEKTVEVPVETTVERTVERRMEVPVEKIIEVPVERIVERILEVSVERIVEVPVDRIVSVEVPVDRIVEVPVDRIVEVPVERIVSVEVPVDRIVEVTMERIVEHSVEVPVDRIIEIPVERIIQLPVERILERHVEVPVDRIVERHIEVPVEMCAVPVGRKRKLRRVEIEAPVAPSTPPSHTLSVPHILWENDSDVPLPLTEQPAVHDERQRLLTDMWKTACLASSAAFTTSTSSSSTASSSPAAFSAVAFCLGSQATPPSSSPASPTVSSHTSNAVPVKANWSPVLRAQHTEYLGATKERRKQIWDGWNPLERRYVYSVSSLFYREEQKLWKQIEHKADRKKDLTKDGDVHPNPGPPSTIITKAFSGRVGNSPGSTQALPSRWRQKRRQPRPRSSWTRHVPASRAAPENRQPLVTKSTKVQRGGDPHQGSSHRSSYQQRVNKHVSVSRDCDRGAPSVNEGHRDLIMCSRQSSSLCDRRMYTSTTSPSSSPSSFSSYANVARTGTLLPKAGGSASRSGFQLRPNITSSSDLPRMASELLVRGLYLGDDVVQLIFRSLQLLHPRSNILLLNACETVSLVRMDATPEVLAPEILAVVPDRVDSESSVCHYAVLHLFFGTSSCGGFARYYDSLGGTACLRVAQSLAALLWALGDVSQPLQLECCSCPRQNTANCALHAALLCRALYLQLNVDTVMAAVVDRFRTALGELLRSLGTTVPDALQLRKLPWPQSSFLDNHSRGTVTGSNLAQHGPAKLVNNCKSKNDNRMAEYAPPRPLVDGLVKQGKSQEAPSTSAINPSTSAMNSCNVHNFNSNFNSNFNDITDSNMYRVLRRNGDRRVVRLAEAPKGRGPLPAGQGVADPWASRGGKPSHQRGPSQLSGRLSSFRRSTARTKSRSHCANVCEFTSTVSHVAAHGKCFTTTCSAEVASTRRNSELPSCVAGYNEDLRSLPLPEPYDKFQPAPSRNQRHREDWTWSSWQSWVHNAWNRNWRKRPFASSSESPRS